MLQITGLRPSIHRLRDAFSAQVRLWDGVLRSLEPWRDEGPLRWHGGQLDGRDLPEAGLPMAPLHGRAD